MYNDFIKVVTPYFEMRDFHFKKGLHSFSKIEGQCECLFELENYKGIDVSLSYGIRFKVNSVLNVFTSPF